MKNAVEKICTVTLIYLFFCSSMLAAFISFRRCSGIWYLGFPRAATHNIIEFGFGSKMCFGNKESEMRCYNSNH